MSTPRTIHAAGLAHSAGNLFVLALVVTAALTFAASSASAAPIAYDALPLTFVTQNDLTNFTVRGFNTGGDYTQRFFVPNPPSPPFMETSLVIDDPASPVQIPLGTLPGDLSSQSNDVNDARTVVGTSFAQNVSPNFGPRDAFVFPFGGPMTMLPRVQHGGEANAINDQGVIVGRSFSDAAGNNPVAARWTFDGASWNVENLGAFGLGSPSARDVNNLGHVLIAGGNQSVVLDGATVTPLPDTSNGFDVLNDLGQALSISNGVLWDPNLGVVNTGLTEVLDINNLGQAVGHLGGDGYLWEGGTLTRLDDLIADPGVDVFRPYAINDAGQIMTRSIAFSTDPALLLIPSTVGPAVPEPGTCGLLALAVSLLLTRRRWRKGRH